MKFKRLPSRIQHRFVKTIAVLFLSLFLLLATGTYILEFIRINNDVKQKLLQQANNNIEKIELRLSYLIQSLETFSTSSLAINSLIDTSGRTSYLPHAINDLTRTKEIKSIVMFDFSGKPIQSNLQKIPDWFNLQTIRPAISIAQNNLLFNKETGSFLIVMPINYYGTPQGGILAEIDLKKLLSEDIDDIHHHYRIGKNWQYSSREKESNVITAYARPTPASLLYPFELELELSQSTKIAMHPVIVTLYEMLLLGLAGFAIAITIAAQAGKKLAQPIILLTERVHKDVHPCGPIGTDDELETLASSFDDKTEKLLDAKNQLEQRVHERTAQLEEKTQQLQHQHKKLEEVNKSLSLANTELKYIDKLKDEFVSTVSHELRTPLTSIRGTLGLIDGGALDHDQEQSKNLIKVALTNSERLSNLIGDLLDMQKFAAGKVEITIDTVSVKDLINNAITGSQGYAQQYQVELNYTENTKQEQWVKADPHRLRQVLDNLISNAIKYSPTNSKVDIYTETKQETIRFCVRDHGKGVPETHKQSIFEKFTQVDASDQRARSGTGLGLSICKDIITAHNGQIGVDNMPNGGALFWFEIEKATSSEAKTVTEPH